LHAKIVDEKGAEEGREILGVCQRSGLAGCPLLYTKKVGERQGTTYSWPLRREERKDLVLCRVDLLEWHPTTLLTFPVLKRRGRNKRAPRPNT